MIIVGLVVIFVGLLFLTWMRLNQFFLLGSKSIPRTEELPPISILKPVKGLDFQLEQNLRSFFQQNYKTYEIIFGVQDPEDPCIEAIQKMCAEFPHIPSKLIISQDMVGLNPKVNNLANMELAASHDIILISDSNIHVRPEYLENLVLHLLTPGTGLVSSPFRSANEQNFAARLEGLHLNTFVMGGVSTMYLSLRRPCVVGKSMLLRRCDLKQIGGFAFLSKYLAEDQVCAEEIHKLGKHLVVTEHVIDNVLGHVSFKKFMQRQIRWALIRRYISPFGYLGEIILNPLFLCAFFFLITHSTSFLVLIGISLIYKSLLDAGAERSLCMRRFPLIYPILVLIKDLTTGALWIVPWVHSSIQWRGNKLWVRKRSELYSPLHESAAIHSI